MFFKRIKTSSFFILIIQTKKKTSYNAIKHYVIYALIEGFMLTQKNAFEMPFSFLWVSSIEKYVGKITFDFGGPWNPGNMAFHKISNCVIIPRA